jgi:hypothetical protein
VRRLITTRNEVRIEGVNVAELIETSPTSRRFYERKRRGQNIDKLAGSSERKKLFLGESDSVQIDKEMSLNDKGKAAGIDRRFTNVYTITCGP